jgi:hypothetical protein
VGFAGAPLVDQHEVAGALDTAENLLNGGRHSGSGLTRAAREKEQRVRFFVITQGRQHDDLQCDLPSATGQSVLENGQGPAIRIDRSFVGYARVKTVQGVRLRGSCAGSRGDRAAEGH